MSKQKNISATEAVKRIAKLEQFGSEYGTLKYNSALTDAINEIEQINEPKKEVVPGYIAKMIEVYHENKISLAYLMKYFKEWHDEVYKLSMDDEAVIWIVNNLEDFVMAWVNGYEVEKEQLYYVKMPKTDLFLNLNKLTGEISFVRFKLDADESGHIKLAESDVPNEYVQFAVKVED